MRIKKVFYLSGLRYTLIIGLSTMVHGLWGQAQRSQEMVPLK